MKWPCPARAGVEKEPEEAAFNAASSGFKAKKGSGAQGGCLWANGGNRFWQQAGRAFGFSSPGELWHRPQARQGRCAASLKSVRFPGRLCAQFFYAEKTLRRGKTHCRRGCFFRKARKNAGKSGLKPGSCARRKWLCPRAQGWRPPEWRFRNRRSCPC